jgi:hypothetical protein
MIKSPDWEPFAAIGAIRVVGPSALEISWTRGSRARTTETADLSPIINAIKYFRPLRDDAALFATAHLIEDGEVIAWSGPDIELTADAIIALLDPLQMEKDDPLFAARARGSIQKRALIKAAEEIGATEGIEEVLAALGVSGPLMQLQFLVTVDPDLGMRPLDALRAGDVAVVMQAARRYGRFGDDGAL